MRQSPLWVREAQVDLCISELERHGMRIRHLNEELREDVIHSVPPDDHVLNTDLYVGVLNVAVAMRNLTSVPVSLRRRWRKFILSLVCSIIEPDEDVVGSKSAGNQQKKRGLSCMDNNMITSYHGAGGSVFVDDEEIMAAIDRVSRSMHKNGRIERMSPILIRAKQRSVYNVLVIATMFLGYLRVDPRKIDRELEEHCLVAGRAKTDCRQKAEINQRVPRKLRDPVIRALTASAHLQASSSELVSGLMSNQFLEQHEQSTISSALETSTMVHNMDNMTATKNNVSCSPGAAGGTQDVSTMAPTSARLENVSTMSGISGISTPRFASPAAKNIQQRG